MVAFASSEHQYLGDDAFLQANLPDIETNNFEFTLANGVQLSFGTLIALAGDFYGIPEKPICLGLSEEERQERFLAAFKTLDQANANDVRNLMSMIEIQRKDVEEAIRKHMPVNEAINCHSMQETFESIEYTKEYFASLAMHNLDHFGENARIAYETGHQLALRLAAQAATFVDPAEQKKILDNAFALEAFACHFLTDQFAAGHTRVPRQALNEKFGPELGSLLSLLQHNEDGRIGLEVTNEFGSSWRAFGDGRLFADYSLDNREQTVRAIKTAIEEVFLSFTQRKVPSSLQVFYFIPHVKENNFSPMFRVNAHQQIYYRSDLSDLQCKTYKLLTQFEVLNVLTHYIEQDANESTIGKKIIKIIDEIKREEENKCKSILPFFNREENSKPPTQDKEVRQSCLCILL